MTQALRIDFVSDIACPWCAIGLSSLKHALEQLGDEVDAEVVVRSFELNPDMPPEGQTLLDYASRKNGSTATQVAERLALIRERGASAGFDFAPRTHVYNTFDGHRLLHWASTQGKALALKEALLKAYHGNGKDPSNHEVLLEAVKAAGLDAAQAQRVLESGEYAAEVRAEVAEFQAMGINSVPSIIFDNRYLVAGGQSADAFAQIIREVLAKRQG
ncbi:MULTISPECIES: DsbA family oxidoreductase [Cupriavidus]|uniref:DSBA oxidoreductase n=1 Tax=Cupriavidus pinatubonensis (strain JMP 134 / LMG 1197) TaxID=264198 RepID=Q471G2_CUPPJ|nr:MULTISPECIES: DsbA family oxidoreductase [Cupriavidus]QYY33152.1 DsbA family oxidoreductase [Cupriavidus pinatubonensis]